MKKLLLFIFALFLWTGAWASKTVWLNPTIWTAANAVFVAYVANNDDSQSEWIDMTETETINGATCYKAVIADTYTKLVLVRDGDRNHDWTIWDQTQDIALSGVADNTLFTITGWDDDNGKSGYTTGVVATYTAKFITNKNWTTTKAYAWSATSTNLGNWGGTMMTNDGTYSSLGTSSKKYSISFKAAPAPQKIIFNNGDDPGEEGNTKTADLTFVDGKTYFLGTEENIAYGATVSWGDDENHTEKINGDAPLSNITDGKDNTNVQVILDSPSTVLSLVLDLGSSKTFNSLMINQTGDRWNTSFRIYVSDNNSDWTEVTANTTGVTSGRFIATFTAQTAQYLKYVSSRTEKNVQDQWGAGLAEIQLYNLASLPTLESIALTASNINPIVNDAVVLTAVGNSSIDGVKIGLGEITWYNDNTDAGTITDGIYTAKAVGESQVSATAGGKTSNTVSITVQSQTLGNFIMPRYIFPAKTAQDFYVSPKTTEGNDFVGSVSYALSTVSAGANAGSLGYNPQANNHIVFGAGGVEGTYRLTGTADEVDIARDFSLVENGPTDPTASLSDVLALYSDHYGATTLYSYPTNYEWGYESKNELNLSGNKCAYVHKLGTYGFEYPHDADLTQYVTLHFDVFTPTATQGKVWIEKTNIKDVPFVTNAGAWTPIDISLEGLAAVENNSYLVHIYFGENNSDKDRDVLIDNVYFEKEAEIIDPSTIESVTVTAASTSIAEGKTTQLTVTDQSSRDVTSLMTFASSNTGVATVDENGLVTAVAASSSPATITATVTGYSVNSTVDITVTEAPIGFEITDTNGENPVHITPYHYAGTNNYKLVITSEEKTITNVNGWWAGGGANKHFDNVTINGHVAIVTETFTAAPQLYNNLYLSYSGIGEKTYNSINNVDLDWIEAVSVTVTDAGRATFSSTEKLDFSVSGVKAYIATSPNSESVTMKEVTRVPANTGLLVKGDEGEYAVAITTKTPDDVSANKLVSTANEAHTITGGEVGRAFVFGRKSGNVGFYKAADGKNVAKGKSYLLFDVAPSNALEFFAIDDESETDGINKVNTLVENGVRYNLAGQRVGNDYKGIVIVNGHKVVIK